MKLSHFSASCALCAFIPVAGCRSQLPADNLKSFVNPSLLVSAQGHLAPGVAVYDDDGAKTGTVIKIDPNYIFPNFKRGGVLMDYVLKGESESYSELDRINKKLVIPHNK